MAIGQSRGDSELQEFREAMLPPTTFEDGFGAKTIIGAIFLGLFMLPGSIYLSLFMGASLGPAARWVTVILFAEVARRSLKSLRQQEIFILFYMSGIALASPFSGLLWNQYLVQSDVAQAMGISTLIPAWVAPQAEVIKRDGNTFFTHAWLLPVVVLISFQLLISRVNGFGLGYVLYRITSHGEKLPFPMAPVNAQGVLVLAEDKENKDRWRFTAFAIGAMLGLGFGLIYVGIPSLTGSILGTPYQLLPIPWLDLTAYTQKALPATPVNIVFDLTLIIIGMVLPFWAVVGGVFGAAAMLILNPLLWSRGYLPSWKEGMGVVDTIYNNQVDFYLSFGIGLTFAVFGISLFTVFWPLVKKAFGKGRAADAAAPSVWREISVPNRVRGDIPIWISLLIYILSTFIYIGICRLMIPDFPVAFFLIFGFIYTPLISYVTAKLEGLVGMSTPIPLVREAAFIFSGYKGVAIWFAPIPIVDYGSQSSAFRTVELTGTRVGSLIKTELVTIPVVIVCSFLFSQFIWRLGPIPSEAYPFTQEVWRMNALNNCLTYTATMGGNSRFIEAIHFSYIGCGLALGIVGYIVLAVASLPTLLLFGFVRGMGAMGPGYLIPEVIGALIGRFYFRRRFGPQQWRKIIPVVAVGFTCGIGLMAMAAVGIALIAKSISTLLY